MEQKYIVEDCIIREVRPGDCEGIYDLICQLAEFEKAGHEIRSSVHSIRESLFPEKETSEHHAQACVQGLICENQSGAQTRIVGFALYFYNYSTWLGKSGIYLEDLYLIPEFRSLGLGKKLLGEIARIAVAQGCERLEWSVLLWNRHAIDFYESVGAQAQSEWQVYRLAGEALSRFATQGQEPEAGGWG